MRTAFSFLLIQKLFYYLLLLTIFSCTGKVPITEDPDFGNVKWGMSMSEVMKCEKTRLYDRNDSVLVNKNFQLIPELDKEFEIVYNFGEKNKLRSVNCVTPIYEYDDEDRIRQNIINHFNRVYGDPIVLEWSGEDVNWKSDGTIISLSVYSESYWLNDEYKRELYEKRKIKKIYMINFERDWREY